MNIICIDEDSQTYVDCPETNYCNLTVNGINHGNYSFVNVNIPSEIARDYTGDNLSEPGIHNQFNINVSGYNVDNEYIEEIIDAQNLQPTNEDFEYLVQGLQVYTPYIMLFMIITFTIRLVNKIFKHK